MDIGVYVKENEFGNGVKYKLIKFKHGNERSHCDQTENVIPIIEENGKMITIAVGDLYTKEDRKLLANLNLNEIFGDQDPIPCKVCSLTFDCQPDLEKHIRLHEHNMHFCKSGCRKYFFFLNQCLDHEYRFHAEDPNLRHACRICETVHKPDQNVCKRTAVRRYICSICRKQFITDRGLVSHWKQNSKNPCGLIPVNHRWILTTGELLYVKLDEVKRKLNYSKSNEIQPRKRVRIESIEKFTNSNEITENINNSIKSVVTDKTKSNMLPSKPLVTLYDKNRLCFSLTNKTTATNEVARGFEKKSIQISKSRVLRELPTVNGSCTTVNNWDNNKEDVIVEIQNNNPNASMAQWQSTLKLKPTNVNHCVKHPNIINLPPNMKIVPITNGNVIFKTT